MNRPPPGSMVWWRRKGALQWHFGYCTYIERSSHLVRMGNYNGDSSHGPVVSANDIEWKKY